MPNSTDGFKLIGFSNENSGLGAALRHLQAALWARGVSFSAVSLDSEAALDSRRANPGEADGSGAAGQNINFFLIPPGSITHLLPRLKPLLLRPGALNAIGVYWELTVLPERYKRSLQLFDAVVGMSHFIQGTLEKELTGPTLINAVQPISLPGSVGPHRDRFNLPADAFVFIAGFDPLSDPSRKNPKAVLEAFRVAFPADQNVRLVFKANVGRGSGGGVDVEKFIRDFRADAERDPRVALITERLPYEDVLSLYASADAYVSLHRSEGLGLGLLESMGLGRPVIATGWSGNRSFMSPRNSCLVSYRLVPVRAILPDYSSLLGRQQPLWAEPNVDDAAQWMRRLAGDRALARRIGDQARADFSAYRERAAELTFVDDLSALGEHLQVTRPGREPALAKRIDAVAQQAQKEDFDFRRWVSGHVTRQFDRHIGWRMSGRRSTR